MYRYKVTVKPIKDETQLGAFTGINMGRDGYHDFDEWDEDGNEVYTVFSEYDISLQLDQSDGVIKHAEL